MPTLLRAFLLVSLVVGSLACSESTPDGPVERLTCGNGRVDPGETCDGSDLAGQSCSSLGQGTGTLRCRADCTGPDLSGCSACTPSCNGRQCGPDPLCGAPCGSCGDGRACNAAGQCVDASCVPDCQGRVCGMDPVCGTLSCGACEEGTCNAQGQCDPSGGCVPNCQGRICGLDPVCGTLSCGTCQSGTCSMGMCVPSCVPDCQGRECGFDPVCGTQSCGTCADGVECVGGYCESSCVPDCSGRECGFDPVCGKSCGTCDAGICTAEGKCLCAPDCIGRECGLDPLCGKSCGSCTGPETCNPDGQCVCAPQCGNRVCGTDPLCGQSCGECTVGSCNETTGQCECTPTCGERECGPDPDCGQSCGTCAEGQACSADGHCVCAQACGGRECGPDPVCGQSCGTCLPTESCDASGQCVCQPDCAGRVCGLDPKCGTSCGQCASGSCTAAGLCSPCTSPQSLCAEGTCTLDEDVATHTVGGSIRLNGQPIPSSWGWRLRFQNAARGESYFTDRQWGGSSYALPVYPGTYDVYFALDTHTDSGKAIWGNRLIQKNLAVDGAETLDIELTSTTVSGLTRVDGADFDPSWSWYLFFYNAATGESFLTDALSSTSTYSIPMFPGVYSVQLQAYNANELPEGSRLVAQSLVVSDNPTLDLDLTTHAVTGTVKWNDQPLSTNVYWKLHFTNRTTKEVFSSRTVTGASTYSVPLYPGTYDVTFEIVAYSGTTPPSMVNDPRPLAQGVVVSGPSTFDVALTVPTVSGAISWNGEPLDTNWTWRLIFKDPLTGERHATRTERGGSSYALPMYPGTWDVYYALSSETLPVVNPSVWGERLVRKGFVVNGNATLDVPLLAPMVSGTISWNGAPIPAGLKWSLKFVEDATSESFVTESRDGGSAYALPMYPGTYSVYFQIQSWTYGMKHPVVGLYRIGGVSLSGPATLNVPLVTREVSSRITRDLAPVDSGHRWRLLYREATTGESFTSEDVGGGETLSAPVYPGHYDVFFGISGTSGGYVQEPIFGDRPLRTCVAVE